MDLQLPKKTPNINFVAPGSKIRHGMFEVILLIVVAVLFYLFLIQPKRSDVASQQEQLATLTEQKNSIQKNKDTLVSLVNKLHSSSDKIAELDEALPLQGRITRYRIAIEQLVSSAGMSIGNISVEYNDGAIAAGDVQTLADPFAKVRKLQKFTTTINVSGSFQQFTGLLKLLENSGRIVDVTGISVISSAEDSLEFRLTTQSYYYE